MKPNVFSRYCGPNTEESSHSGVKGCLRGHRILIATSTDFLTDEDCEHASKVTKVLMDTFLRRTSLEDKAMHGLAELANNVLLRKSMGQEQTLCAVAAIFGYKGKCRWLTAGGSMAYYFENGRLVRQSRQEPTPPLGAQAQYFLEPEEAFELGVGENAFLVCSKEMAWQLSTELLEKTLKNAKTADEWIKNLISQIGEDRQFCANAMILPGRRRKPPRRGLRER